MIVTCLCSLCYCSCKSRNKPQHDTSFASNNTANSTVVSDTSDAYDLPEMANLATLNQNIVQTPPRPTKQTCSLFDKTKIPIHLLHTSHDCKLCKVCLSHGKPPNLTNCPECNISWQEPITLTSTAGHPWTAPPLNQSICNTSPIKHIN